VLQPVRQQLRVQARIQAQRMTVTRARARDMGRRLCATTASSRLEAAAATRESPHARAVAPASAKTLGHAGAGVGTSAQYRGTDSISVATSMFPATPDSPLLVALGRRGTPGKGMDRSASLPELELDDMVSAHTNAKSGSRTETAVAMDWNGDGDVGLDLVDPPDTQPVSGTGTDASLTQSLLGHSGNMR